MESAEVCSELAELLDLVGPSDRLGSPAEILPQSPSRWYLTGFLVPLDAEEAQRVDGDGTDDLDIANDAGGTHTTPEPASARQRYRSSSIGLSVLVPPAPEQLKVAVRWGDYKRRTARQGQSRARGVGAHAADSGSSLGGPRRHQQNLGRGTWREATGCGPLFPSDLQRTCFNNCCNVGGFSRRRYRSGTISP